MAVVVVSMVGRLGPQDLTVEPQRPESSATGPDRGVLADADARRRHALAYRATVDAVYAGAATEARRLPGGVSRGAGGTETAQRPGKAERYPDTHVRSADPPSRVNGPAQHPADRGPASRHPAVLDQIELIGFEPSIGILARTARPATVLSSDAFYRSPARHPRRAIASLVTSAKRLLAVALGAGACHECGDHRSRLHVGRRSRCRDGSEHASAAVPGALRAGPLTARRGGGLRSRRLPGNLPHRPGPVRRRLHDLGDLPAIDGRPDDARS
jgi:hypothetical protein